MSQRPSLTKWHGKLNKSHAIAAMAFVLLSIFFESPVGYQLDNLIARRIDFKVRRSLHMEPVLDPRIKILSFDNITMDLLHADNIELSAWGKLLTDISALKPKLVLIDKRFGLIGTQDAKNSFDGINNTPTTSRTITGGYVEPLDNAITDGVSLDGRDDFSLPKLLQRSGHDEAAILNLNWLPVTRGTLIGPDKTLVYALKNIGHFQAEGFGFIRPLIRLDEKLAVPHFTLLTADKFSITPKNLLINDKIVHLDSHDLIVPNIISASIMDLRTISLRTFIYRSSKNIPLDHQSIKEGDIVVILPLMFPGNTDWVDAPLEKQQGGYVMASMVNSVLQDNWLRPIGSPLPLLALACLLGFWLASRLRPLHFTLTLVASLLVIATLGILTFCQFGLIVPWLAPATGLAASGLAVFANLTILNELRLAGLKTALQGRISKERIAQIVKDPTLLQVAPAGKIVSIMFVDIVGFSQISDQQSPEEVFHHLKELFALLRSVVLEYGGVVDKTIGDGMLAYFGYGPDGQHSSREHADDALKSGIAIQKRVLELNKKNSALGSPIYPLRIGINTSSVFVGNIGDEDHYDFTVIGHGVNIAKRLETACRHYCVNIGATTFDTLVNRKNLTQGLAKRLIPIKHVDAPLECYECDPFKGDAKSIADISSDYRKSLSIDRKDDRWPIPDDLEIILDTSYGPARLVDFSRTGFAFSLEKYMGVGVLLEFQLSPEGQNSYRATKFTTAIVGEIRWARPVGTRYLHGILIKNLAKEQREQLVEHFRSRIHQTNELIFEN